MVLARFALAFLGNGRGELGLFFGQHALQDLAQQLVGFLREQAPEMVQYFSRATRAGPNGAPRALLYTWFPHTNAGARGSKTSFLGEGRTAVRV